MFNLFYFKYSYLWHFETDFWSIFYNECSLYPFKR